MGPGQPRWQRGRGLAVSQSDAPQPEAAGRVGPSGGSPDSGRTGPAPWAASPRSARPHDPAGGSQPAAGIWMPPQSLLSPVVREVVFFYYSRTWQDADGRMVDFFTAFCLLRERITNWRPSAIWQNDENERVILAAFQEIPQFFLTIGKLTRSKFFSVACEICKIKKNVRFHRKIIN